MLVSETSDVFLRKARESLAGATSELANGRYNNAANRAYYACFQAAIAALESAGLHPPAGKGWSHAFVQAQFAGVLIGRRKAYPAALRDTLGRAQQLRNQADYERADVGLAQAARGLSRARAFVEAVMAHATGGTRA
jgi:uncharacterized protein (UPF0332 family)